MRGLRMRRQRWCAGGVSDLVPLGRGLTKAPENCTTDQIGGEQGALTSRVGPTFSLADTAAAHEAVEQGTIGNVIIGML